MSLLLTLNGLTHCSGIFIVDIEQIHGEWVNCYPMSLTNFTSGFHFLTHCSGIFIVDIEQIHGGWVNCYPMSLTNFTSGFHFYTHENRKPKVFRGIKLEHWPEVGLLIQFYLKHFLVYL